MASFKSLRLAGALLLPAAVVTAALAAACSNDSNPQPGVPVYSTDSGSDTSVATKDAGGGGDDGGDGGGPASEASTQDGPSFDAQPDVDAAACTSDSGCWSCTPTTTPQFLNQCTGSTCSPFANATRLPNYDGGALPPLP